MNSTELNSPPCAGFFLRGDCMNKLEARQNIQSLESDKAKLLNLNHLNSSYAFKASCEQRIKQINESLRNIHANLARK